jgi:glycosyltransferase involved in cell wall biosynthesis
VVSQWPRNWTSIPFDSVGVDAFLRELDFFVHYPHEEYIEEYGRNVAEAMDVGVPAILPPAFEEVFGGAAVYSEPFGVKDTIERLWSEPDRYDAVVAAGHAYVNAQASLPKAKRRLSRALAFGLEH